MSENDTLHRILTGCAVADADWLRETLATLAPAWRQRAWRLVERDAAIRELARLDDHRSGRKAAVAVATALRRYGSTTWLFECGRPAPTEPRRALLHRVLSLSGGKPPSAASIRRIIAGIGSGSKTPAEMSRKARDLNPQTRDEECA